MQLDIIPKLRLMVGDLAVQIAVLQSENEILKEQVASLASENKSLRQRPDPLPDGVVDPNPA